MKQAASIINNRQEEISIEIREKIKSHVPSGSTRITGQLIEKCLTECAYLQREYDSLQTAYNLLFITPYNPV